MSAAEREYVVPLREAWRAPRAKRAPRAIKALREFIEKHMKASEVVITNEVNEVIWARGIQKPPRRIKIRAVKDSGGVVTVYLAGGRREE